MPVLIHLLALLHGLFFNNSIGNPEHLQVKPYTADTVRLPPLKPNPPIQITDPPFPVKRGFSAPKLLPNTK